jgi:endogenous inhibitor of DNA gyrase (YacG/DUF329 family)
LNCPYCGNEVEDEDATVCPNCGKSLTIEDETEQDVIEVPQKRTDLVLAAAILTMLSATFVASLGYLGVYQYFAMIDYYMSYYGYSVASEVLGFLIFGIEGVIAAAFALAGATAILKRKWFKFSMLGTVFPLVSVIVTLICVLQYGYAFTDMLIFAEVSTAMLSVMGTLLNFVSRKEYT